MSFDWDEYESYGQVDGLVSRSTVLELIAYGRALEAERDALRADAESFLNAEDMADLIQFNDQCEDFESGGYSASKETMKRLAELGAVQSFGFGRYGVTSFGSWLIEKTFKQNPALPLKTTAEYNFDAAIAAKGSK